MLADFWLRYRIIILVIGFIVITMFLGYTIYSLFFQPVIIPPGEPGEITGGPLGPGGFPIPGTGPGQIIDEGVVEPLPATGEEVPGRPASPVAQGNLTKTNQLNNVPSFGATIGPDGSQVQYYDVSSGQFFQVNKDGETVLLSAKAFPNVTEVVWSPNKKKAILEFPDGANIIYDFDAERQISLPTHWKDFSFSPNGENIVMKSIGLDPENRWLAITNDEGSEVQTLEFIGEKDRTVYPAWSSNNQIVAMYTKGVDFDRQEVFFVGLNDENFKSTIIEGRGFQPKWSPRGDRLLYSVYSNQDDLKPSLWIVNAQGEAIGSGRKKLNIETWANKCAFGSNTEFYCAVPENLPAGAGLFPDLAKNNSDRFFRIDSQTGQKKLIAIPDGQFNAKDLIISDNGYYLYFTDANTNRIHQIKLK